MICWGGFCVFYMLSFGAKHGEDVARLWLKTFFFGWVQRAVLNEPQLIFVKHVLFPVFLVQSLEKSSASASRWHLLHHVFIHSAETSNRHLPVGGVHRLAVEMMDMPVSK